MINIINNFKFLCVITAFFGCILSTYGSDKSPLTADSSSAPTPMTRTALASMQQPSTDSQISELREMIMGLYKHLHKEEGKNNHLLGSGLEPLPTWQSPSTILSFGSFKIQSDIRKGELAEIKYNSDLTSNYIKRLNHISELNLDIGRKILNEIDNIYYEAKIKQKLSQITPLNSGEFLQERLQHLRSRGEFKRAQQLEVHWIQPGYWTATGVNPDHMDEFIASMQQVTREIEAGKI